MTSIAILFLIIQGTVQFFIIQGIAQVFPTRPVNYVTDEAQILPPLEEHSINSRLKILRDSTGVEIAVVTLFNIKNYAPAEVSRDIGRAWGVGAKGGPGEFAKNAGIVLLVVPKTQLSENKGHCFISTGTGSEGWLTDAKAGILCRNAVNNYFRAGNYSEGIQYILSNIVSLAYTEYANFNKTPEQKAAELELANKRDKELTNKILFLIALIGGIAFVLGIIVGIFELWNKKNKTIKSLERDLYNTKLSLENIKASLELTKKRLNKFTYPNMSIKSFTKYFNSEQLAEEKREAERLRKLAEKAEKERKEKEYWESPAGQLELKRREALKKAKKEEEEQRRRNRNSDYYGSSSYRSGGGSSSSGGFGGFGGGGSFSGGGGGKSW